MPRRRLLPVRDWPLSLKLATTVLVLAVIPLLLVAWFNARAVESQSLLRETHSLQRRAAAAARRLEERVGRLRASVELVTHNPTIIAAMRDREGVFDAAPDERGPGARAWDARHPEIFELLTSLRRASPWFSNVYLLDTDGVCLATSERATKPEMVGRPYDYRPYFQAAIEDRDPFVTDVLKNATSPGTGIFVSAPVWVDDEVAGVAVLKVEATALHEVVADLARTGGSALLVDRFGVVVSDAWTGTLRDVDDPRSLQFHPLDSVDRFRTLFEQTRRYGTPDGVHYLDRVAEPLPLKPLWNALQGRRSGAAEHAVPPGFAEPPVPTMVGYAPVVAGPSEPYGYVLLGEPAAEFRGPLAEIAESSLWRTGLVALGVALIIALLIRRFSRQVVGLARAASRLAAGQRAGPLTQGRHDELGVLAESIDRLAEHARDAVADQQRAREASEADRDTAQARDRARGEAIARAHGVLDEACRALHEAHTSESRAGLRRALSRLEGMTIDLAVLGERGDPVPASPSRVDASAVVREVVQALEAESPERSLSVEAPPELPAVQTDRAMVRRIVEHLVDNALKFTRRGGVRVRVRAQGEGVVLSVADTGIGLTARQVARISAATDEPIGEGGIGLWVTRRLARTLGASLGAWGEVGHGSVVAVGLPPRPGAPPPDLRLGPHDGLDAPPDPADGA